LTPEPPVLSVAVRPTTTALLYQPVEQAVLLQLAVVVGGELSSWIDWEFTASVLPALSTEKNLTVDVLATWNGPVY
jgi:hypothetical protein